MSKPRAIVKDMRASFEALSKTTPATPIVSIQPPSFQRPKMSTTPTDTNLLPKIPSIKSSIDAVLGSSEDDKHQQQAPTPATELAPSQPTPNLPNISLIPRPSSLAKSQRPSWIGPKADRPAIHGGIPKMKQPVTIDYTSPGLKPPVYIFTDLSDPQWEAVEMNSGINDSGEAWFFKHFDAEEGEYQYKFRLGPGDWWVCDENKPLVDDGFGNKNNKLVVKSAASSTGSSAQPATTEKAVPASTTPATEQPKSTGPITVPATAPLLPHETVTTSAIQSTATPSIVVADAAASASAPLMGHETLSPRDVSVDNKHDLQMHDEHESPLLQHETLHADAGEETHAPLLKHESIGLAENQSEATAYQAPSSSIMDAIAPEADLNDATLERFPTDHDGILEHIRRASTQIQDDEVASSPGSAISETLTSPISPIVSLPSVREDEEERDPEMDPLAPALIVSAPSDASYPAAPMTPPMTPKEAGEVMTAVAMEAEAEKILEGVIKERQQNEANVELQEKMLDDRAPQRGIFATLSDVLSNPLSWFAFVGIVVAVAAFRFR